MNFLTLQTCVLRIPLEHRWLQADGVVNSEQLQNDLAQILVDCQVDFVTAHSIAMQIVEDTTYLVADIQGQDIYCTGFGINKPYLLNAEIERFLRRHIATRLCRLLQSIS